MATGRQTSTQSVHRADAFCVPETASATHSSTQLSQEADALPKRLAATRTQ